jgi:four helix bundle protein
MKKENLIQQISFNFALKVIDLYKELCGRKEYILSKQILRSGTSIGANVEEAIGAQTRKDFISKISIAHKEARETLYWLKLLYGSKLVSANQNNELYSDCEEIIRVSGKIQKTAKVNESNSI